MAWTHPGSVRASPLEPRPLNRKLSPFTLPFSSMPTASTWPSRINCCRACAVAISCRSARTAKMLSSVSSRAATMVSTIFPRDVSSADWIGASPDVLSASTNVSGSGFVFRENRMTFLSIIVFSFLDPEAFHCGHVLTAIGQLLRSQAYWLELVLIGHTDHLLRELLIVKSTVRVRVCRLLDEGQGTQSEEV